MFQSGELQKSWQTPAAGHRRTLKFQRIVARRGTGTVWDGTRAELQNMCHMADPNESFVGRLFETRVSIGIGRIYLIFVAVGLPVGALFEALGLVPLVFSTIGQDQRTV